MESKRINPILTRQLAPARKQVLPVYFSWALLRASSALGQSIFKERRSVSLQIEIGFFAHRLTEVLPVWTHFAKINRLQKKKEGRFRLLSG
jgi:hypothetical protein